MAFWGREAILLPIHSICLRANLPLLPHKCINLQIKSGAIFEGSRHITRFSSAPSPSPFIHSFIHQSINKLNWPAPSLTHSPTHSFTQIIIIIIVLLVPF
jgi:hypothetical protein